MQLCITKLRNRCRSLSHTQVTVAVDTMNQNWTTNKTLTVSTEGSHDTRRENILETKRTKTEIKKLLPTEYNWQVSACMKDHHKEQCLRLFFHARKTPAKRTDARRNKTRNDTDKYTRAQKNHKASSSTYRMKSTAAATGLKE